MVMVVPLILAGEESDEIASVILKMKQELANTKNLTLCIVYIYSNLIVIKLKITFIDKIYI